MEGKGELAAAAAAVAVAAAADAPRTLENLKLMDVRCGDAVGMSARTAVPYDSMPQVELDGGHNAFELRCAVSSDCRPSDTLFAENVQMWNLAMLLDNLGFDTALTRRALMRADGNDNKAANLLLDAAVDK